MNARLLQYYNQELEFVRAMGAEFKAQYPKIAKRLGLEDLECADPYVERLLESFAFLTARVQLKLDAEFPRFTQHLLEMVYPHYLAPTPSMAVVRLFPDLTEGDLAAGFELPRGTVLRSVLGKNESTACEYRTVHDIRLWPLEVTDAGYYASRKDLSGLGVTTDSQAVAAVRIRVHSTAGLQLSALALDRLDLFLNGGDGLAERLHEQVIANTCAILVRPVDAKATWQRLDDAGCCAGGLEDSDALLPYGLRSFQGYRLLQEYFAFPQRYLFARLTGLRAALARCAGQQADILVLLDRADDLLEGKVDANSFALHCTPAINLFPKRADRIHLNPRDTEFHVVPDRNRPLDYEVYQVTGVTGHGTSADEECDFLPFYSTRDRTCHETEVAYYTTQRRPRMTSSKQRRRGPRSSYLGHEVFLSLVDSGATPYSSALTQLSVQTLCSNRDLPLHMAVGQGRTDFTLEVSAPVDSIRCVVGPTPPRPTHLQGEASWRLIDHLSLNYVSLLDTNEQEGAAALRQMLGLYGSVSDPAIRRQIEGVRSIRSHAVTRRLPTPGPIAFGRGLEITLEVEEAAFEGAGIFLLGGVLEQFFAKHVSINSFTETVLRSDARGEVHRWPMRTGLRHVL